MNAWRRGGLAATLAAIVPGRTPAQAWTFLEWRKNDALEAERRQAMTMFKTAQMAAEGGEYADLVTHLLTPSEAREAERVRRQEIDRARLAMFQGLASRNPNVRIE